MAGENGGGTFVLAYAICILAIGIPLYVLESSAGKLTQRGPVGLFRQINPQWGPWAGWFLVVMTIAIMSYYLVVSGWTKCYNRSWQKMLAADPDSDTASGRIRTDDRRFTKPLLYP